MLLYGEINGYNYYFSSNYRALYQVLIVVLFSIDIFGVVTIVRENGIEKNIKIKEVAIFLLVFLPENWQSIGIIIPIIA